MSERRIINKPGQKTTLSGTPGVVGVENIMVKPKGVEDRLRETEEYLHQIDPILRAVVKDMQDTKNMLTALNDEITKIAGVQSRTNSYLDGKLAEINSTFGAIVAVVKKIDDDYQALFNEEVPQEVETQNEEPELPNEYDNLYEEGEEEEQAEQVEVAPPTPKADKKKK